MCTSEQPLFLSVELLIGIAPRTDLQAAADPAEAFVRVRSRVRAADAAALRPRRNVVAAQSRFGGFEDPLIDNGLGFRGRQWFLLH